MAARTDVAWFGLADFFNHSPTVFESTRRYILMSERTIFVIAAVSCSWSRGGVVIAVVQPEQFVQAMVQSELGLSEHRFPNQWTAATWAGISTAIGAPVPIIPFFFSGGVTAVVLSFSISLLAHFLVGALKSLITIRSWWASGLEMT
jgi:VIT1/CCC1 family predicted Fe2+/Mn2+ transporter